ncbi:MAG: hypothetical protein WCP73_01350, partial [Eubacteriales bacterium]
QKKMAAILCLPSLLDLRTKGAFSGAASIAWVHEKRTGGGNFNRMAKLVGMLLYFYISTAPVSVSANLFCLC